jgi:hypothetical protein
MLKFKDLTETESFILYDDFEGKNIYRKWAKTYPEYNCVSSSKGWYKLPAEISVRRVAESFEFNNNTKQFEVIPYHKQLYR